MIIRDDIINEKRHWRCLADNLDDVQDWLRTSPKRWMSDSAQHNSATANWDLGLGYAGALELARSGWSEGAKDLSNRLEAHLPPRDKADSWRYDVAGERPDIGRYLSGDPACMMRHCHPKGHKPILSLAVNIRLRCDIKASAMANYGAALVAIIDRLEHTGRRVELIATFATNFPRAGRLSAGWVVKKAEDPLDLAAVAFSTAHPAASRRIGFALCEHSDLPNDSSYGFDIVMGENDLVDPLPGTYCLEGLSSYTTRCHTLDDAIAFARDQVNSAAGEIMVEAA